MFASKTLLALFAAAATVSARVVPRNSPPAGWWTEGLEDYNAYHTRYLALGCQNNHGTEFFDACCHPLKKDETLETARAPECIPSASASASASLAEPTSTVTIPDDDSSSSVSSPAVNVATGGGDEEDNENDEDDDDCDAEDDDDDDDDGDDEDCGDDGDDETSSSLPDPTVASEPSSTLSEASGAETPSTAAPSSTSSSGGDVVTGGFATFYYQNGNAGACGDVNPDSALIGAIDSRRYGVTSQRSDLCGKQVKITNTNNNKSVVITIADACPTCDNENCIDLSTAAFDQLADESEGEVPIDWEFV